MPEISTGSIIMRWSAIVLLFCLLLFVPAGTLYWAEAWIFLIAYVAAAAPLIRWLRKNDPELLEQRMQFLKIPEKRWDKAVLSLWMVLTIAEFVTAGIDERFQWSQLPSYMEVLGFMLFIPAGYLFFTSFRENSYAYRTVEVQKAQKVISTGPYAFVRHPLYLGAIIFFMSIPLALGSLYALIPASLLAVVVVIRTSLEDRELHKSLGGYEEYSRKTRYRLFPGIW